MSIYQKFVPTIHIQRRERQRKEITSKAVGGHIIEQRPPQFVKLCDMRIMNHLIELNEKSSVSSKATWIASQLIDQQIKSNEVNENASIDESHICVFQSKLIG